MKQLYSLFFACLLASASWAQSAEEYIAQGQKAHNEQNYTQAVEHFEKAIALDKKNAQAQAGLGWALIKTERYSKALAHLKNAAKIAPTEGTYLYYQAVALDSMRRERDVLEVTGKALKMKLDVPDLYEIRAQVFLRKKDYNTAIANLNKTIELNNKQKTAYLKRAFAKYRVVDSAGACADWRTALALGAKEAQAMLDAYCKE